MKLKLSNRKRKPFDANFKLPNDLTTEFRNRFNPISSLKADYLIDHLWSKFVSMDTAPSNVRRQRAINKWLATEANNSATNDRLLATDPGFNILPRVRFDTFTRKLQSLIEDVIGSTVPSFETEDVTVGLFSGGATTSRNRNSSQPALKYVGEADVTARCLHWAMNSLDQSPIWSLIRQRDSIRVVEGNVLFTVPKNAEIDRCACKEPDLNMYYQKGVGDYIRNRLRRFGIDLNDQSRNQTLARVASIDGSLATIDLSSASDSISYELVALCLPIHWLVYLDDLRSPVTIIDGERHVNHMYSSMGNGFTFELESLIFWAISKTVAYYTNTRGIVSVYGDDIIVPTQMSDDLIYVLSYFGFSVNTEKSFTSGPIRESCGGHYSSGLDITPFYIREPITTLRSVITLANQLRKWAGVDHSSDILDLDVQEVWNWLSSHVPKCYWGGYDLNDSSRLVSYWTPFFPKKLVPISGKPRRCDHGGLALWLNIRVRSNRDLRSPIHEGLETSSYRQVSGRYRSKNVNWTHGTVERVFLSELTVT